MGSTLKIMPTGDSITRGSYLSGLSEAEKAGLPNHVSGGWRKGLQDRLRTAGIAFEFVGELDYGAYGHDGVVDPDFSPRHHGLAGFSNHALRVGGVVPTPPDVLEAYGVEQIHAPDIVTALDRNRPDIVLLMSGSNGFDAAARDELIETVLTHLDGHLLVASIPPQCPPRPGYEQVEPYNASLTAAVARSAAAGKPFTQVDMHAALSTQDLLEDGVHPSAAGMEKMAEVWWQALQRVLGLTR